jgi:predicted patatin/cPLA2 family phospholipase
MGQELFDVDSFYEKKPRRYYVATNNKGFMVVRSSASKYYSHAVVAKTPTKWGAVYSTFTTRLQLANRYCKSWNNKYKEYEDGKEFEVVVAKEVSSKEFRLAKKEIQKRYDEADLANKKKIVDVYEVSMNYENEEEQQLWDTEVVSATKN